ncbi:N-acetylglucosamine/diacetylchitobiose ABC transporter substrate-binding protein [Streptomyces sp. YIM 98790]|uniref:N-acetylglucosamine/diacetylchitobiose ABC transporter substrate-binding protein n=1 Tax=Streptomyces sp. YIM 98790 TaxID=2689077 RepID=UPI00140AD377|nr:N-acetylglucosamine/diacetylchitobiose ABC transporter substrate-binding protein [Streptomyces sp. YIM 98790]
MTSSPYLNRRTLIRRSAAAGLTALPAVTVLSACASGGGGGGGKEKNEPGEVTERNPFGLAEDADVEVLIFNGGFEDQYAKDVGAVYEEHYGSVEHNATEEISARVQARMVSGNPPDMINNSGADLMPMPALLKEGQVADLRPLFDAPSWDDPAVPVRDTLLPGTVESGQYGGQEVYVLNYAFTVYGTWYSRRLLHEVLEEEYPQTWDQMLAVCEKAKKQDIYGWTYAGHHARYLSFTMMPMMAKVGGREVFDAIDRLEPNAWKHDAVVAVFEAYEEIAAKGYLLPGTPGINHTESQTEWAKNKALFIPCGTWLENESKADIAPDAQIAVGAATGLDSSDALPFGTLYATAGEPFIVPADAANPRAGMEFLRIMLSRDSARNFTEKVSSLTSVAGAADGLELPPGLTSAQEAVAAAGENIIAPRFREWYPVFFSDVMGVAMGEMMAGELTAAEALDKIQAGADAVAADDSVEKYL